jgi:hypothetical protein
MKVIVRGYGVGMTPQERAVARSNAADAVRNRGTAKKPLPPRDLLAQSGPRGILVNWRKGAGFTSDTTGYRIYKGTEASLFAEIHDANTMQHFIEATAGAAPPVTNIFVSSINKLGVESAKVQVQSVAAVEAGAPIMPSTPPSFQINITLPPGTEGA